MEAYAAYGNKWGLSSATGEIMLREIQVSRGRNMQIVASIESIEASLNLGASILFQPPKLSRPHSNNLYTPLHLVQGACILFFLLDDAYFWFFCQGFNNKFQQWYDASLASGNVSRPTAWLTTTCVAMVVLPSSPAHHVSPTVVRPVH
jgi:hypothetical protein